MNHRANQKRRQPTTLKWKRPKPREKSKRGLYTKSKSFKQKYSKLKPSRKKAQNWNQGDIYKHKNGNIKYIQEGKSTTMNTYKHKKNKWWLMYKMTRSLWSKITLGDDHSHGIEVVRHPRFLIWKHFSLKPCILCKDPTIKNQTCDIWMGPHVICPAVGHHLLLCNLPLWLFYQRNI